MINLQTDAFSIVLVDAAWTEQARPDAPIAAILVDEYPLSDAEAATAFVALELREARVEGKLREQLACAKPPSNSEQTLVLIRWSDDTESLVSFPTASGGPSPELLKAAYRNGYAAGCLKRSVDAASRHVAHEHHRGCRKALAVALMSPALSTAVGEPC